MFSSGPPNGVPDMSDILQVPESASGAEIKTAYRRLVRRLHPDINPTPSAAARLQVSQDHSPPGELGATHKGRGGGERGLLQGATTTSQARRLMSEDHASVP